MNSFDFDAVTTITRRDELAVKIMEEILRKTNPFNLTELYPQFNQLENQLGRSSQEQYIKKESLSTFDIAEYSYRLAEDMLRERKRHKEMDKQLGGDNEKAKVRR